MGHYEGILQRTCGLTIINKIKTKQKEDHLSWEIGRVLSWRLKAAVDVASSIAQGSLFHNLGATAVTSLTFVVKGSISQRYRTRLISS